MPIVRLAGIVSRPAETMVKQIDLISAGSFFSSLFFFAIMKNAYHR